ncbi:MAG: methyltransferase [Myxococcota bacterium]
MEDLTRDGVCRGFLQLWQPRRGYRYNLDSVLLGALAAGVVRDGLVLDVGAGSGIVGLYVGKASGARVVLVERQAAWIPVLRRNVVENGVTAEVVRADFRELPLRDHSVALLTCNPPFTTPGTGRPSPLGHKQLSRHAAHGGAQEVLDEADRVLAPDGVQIMVLPLVVAQRLQPRSLHLQRRILLSAQAGAPPDRALTVHTRQPATPQEETRAVHDPQGRFASWVEEILEGRARVLR